MYFVIMLYGMNVARSIIEEKTSRVFEVLLATIRPEEMMAGKIIGVGSVGLTQVGIWLALPCCSPEPRCCCTLGAAVCTSPSPRAGHLLLHLLPPRLPVLLLIAAALGAMTNSEQELQQLNMFLVLPCLLLDLAGTVLTSPDSHSRRVVSLIPFFTPLMMYLRVSLGHPAPWEIALSIVLISSASTPSSGSPAASTASAS